MHLKIPKPYLIHILLYLAFIIFSFSQNTFNEIFSGLILIIQNSDILITDYIHISNIGATFINSSILGLISILLFLKTKCPPTGASLMSLWLITGFGFFGKNILNVWPIILGVFLYSKFKKEDFKDYILVAILGTTLAPTVSQFSFATNLSVFCGILAGLIVGILIGFILPSISKHSLKVHGGFNLYNVGFSGGIIATAVMSLLRALGYDFESNFSWYTGSNYLFTGLMFLVSFYFIVCGFILTKNKSIKYLLNNIISINKESGRLPSDYYLKYGYISFINMGILGIVSTFIVILTGASLNGPTMGAIFTMIGFGCYGKSLANTLPVIAGSLISSVVNVLGFSSPSMILSIMFSTGLAPISGYFGWIYGVIAGFLHVSMVNNIGYLHGGLNLYNNGLACGFVAMLMIPIITSVKNIKLD